MFSWKGKNLGELDANKVKRNIPAYVILTLAVGAMTFFGVCSPSGNQMLGPTGSVATVDGEKISPIEFRRAHINQTQRAQQQYKDAFDPVKQRISQTVVNDLVNQLILYKESLKNGFYASDEEIAQMIVEGEYFKGENNKFDRSLFSNFLKNQRYTEASFSDQLRKDIVNSKLRSFVTTTFRSSKYAAKLDKQIKDTKLEVDYVKVSPSNVDIKVTADQISKYLEGDGKVAARRYYDNNQSEFKKEGQVRARHILIAFEGAERASGDARKRPKNDAMKLAKQLASKAKKGNFIDLAKKYTDEPSGKTKGGDLGFFKKGDMVPEFSQKAFSMKKGEVSDIVETKFGFHIIKVEDVRLAKNTTYEQAERNIAKALLEKEDRPKKLSALADKVLKAAKAGEKIQNLGLSWTSSGEFALNARFLPGGLGSSKDMKDAVLSLTQPGQVYDKILSEGNAFFVVKLKSRQVPDLTSISDQELQEMADASKYMEAFWMFSKLSSDIRKSYEDEKRVFRNEDFMQYDAILRSRSGA